MSGIGLAEQIIEEKPETKVLVMSGYPENEMLASEQTLSVFSETVHVNRSH